MNDRQMQITDQALKTSFLGLLTYILTKVELDAELVALMVPLVGSIIAWASTRVGDKAFASFLTKKTD